MRKRISSWSLVEMTFIKMLVVSVIVMIVVIGNSNAQQGYDNLAMPESPSLSFGIRVDDNASQCAMKNCSHPNGGALQSPTMTTSAAYGDIIDKSQATGMDPSQTLIQPSENDKEPVKSDYERIGYDSHGLLCLEDFLFGLHFWVIIQRAGTLLHRRGGWLIVMMRDLILLLPEPLIQILVDQLSASFGFAMMEDVQLPETFLLLLVVLIIKTVRN